MKKIDPENIALETFDNEVVLINVPEGRYYSVRGAAGVYTIKRLLSGISEQSLGKEINERFTQLSPNFSQDINVFFSKLEAEKIIIPGGEFTEPESVSQTDEYTPIDIEIYDDMQELIQLDPVHDVESFKGWPQKKTNA